MVMQDSQDNYLDEVVSTSLRAAQTPSPGRKRLVREELLRRAAAQRAVMLTTLPPPAQSPTHPLMYVVHRTFEWVFDLCFGETCYDRARRVPERSAANAWRPTHLEAYFVVRPAF
jgi:hypothetical protein